jgi:hypothetical protein
MGAEAGAGAGAEEGVGPGTVRGCLQVLQRPLLPARSSLTVIDLLHLGQVNLIGMVEVSWSNSVVVRMP